MRSRSHTLRIIVTTVMKMEITIPMIGAKNINNTVFMMVSESTILDHGKSNPLIMSACAIAAPAKPPINV